MAHEGGFCTSSRAKAAVLALALALVAYASVPPLFRHLSGPASARHDRHHLQENAGICAPCACDCPSTLHLTDCHKPVPALHEEVDVNFLDLLIEELKSKESVSKEKQLLSESVLLDAKRLASQLQKEADKCTSGMETCDQIREKMERVLAAEKEITSKWEQRAKELGWQGPNGTQKQKERSLASTEEEINENEDSSFF